MYTVYWVTTTLACLLGKVARRGIQGEYWAAMSPDIQELRHLLFRWCRIECVISLTPLQEGPKFNFKSVKVGSLPRLPDIESRNQWNNMCLPTVYGWFPATFDRLAAAFNNSSECSFGISADGLVVSARSKISEVRWWDVMLHHVASIRKYASSTL